MTSTMPDTRPTESAIGLRPRATRAHRRLRGAWNRARRADFDFLEVDRGGLTENRVELVSGATARAISRVTPSRHVGLAPGRLLIGGEPGVTAKQLAGSLGDPLRPSTPLSKAPLVELLRRFKAGGEAVLRDDALRDTQAFRDALTLARTDAGSGNDKAVLDELRHTIVDASGAALVDPVPVRRIRGSEYWQVQATSLGLINAVADGTDTVGCVVVPGTVTTPVQDLLLQMSWLGGSRLLYQPVPAPELEGSWPLVRQCVDRLEMMRGFLETRTLAAEPSYLDVASAYGWFVAEMRDAGFDAHGVERDELAIRFGQWVYGLDDSSVVASDAEPYLESTKHRFDVVSCFSLLHHLVMFEGEAAATALLEKLDHATGDVLFIDTGEAHESWLSNLDPRWEPRFIERWLVDHTTFTEAIALGTDRDRGRAENGENYGRTLFACVR